jgi:hypothetical protein
LRADIKTLRRALGNPKPPKELTQEPYERNPGHLRRLVRGDWSKGLPKSGDLFDYVEDINFCDVVQPELFRYLLPVLLEMWRQDLMSENCDNAGTVEWFYLALARRRIVTHILDSEAGQAVSSFMSDAILDRIDKVDALRISGATGSRYNWIGAIVSLGVMFPAIEPLWRKWWAVDSLGQARALLQYASELIYVSDNPLFPEWSPEQGGGSPCIWETEGHIHGSAWLPENVRFLRRALTVEQVESRVKRAVGILRGNEPDTLLGQIANDLRRRRNVLERRTALLPEVLSGDLDRYLSWGELEG